MILIISNELDTTTGDVMDYLLFKNELKSIRINELSINSLPKLKIEINNASGIAITLDDKKVKFIWNRKYPKITTPEAEFPELNRFYEREYAAILSFFDLISMSEIDGLGSVYFNPQDVNKLYVLSLANKFGIRIPETVVVNNKSDFKLFIKGINGNCITKPIQSIVPIHDKDNGRILKMLTSMVSGRENIDNFFFPSLLQKEIVKIYELRVFFVYGEFRTVAIFSQSNDKTKVDFRNYDNEKPNRIMNYSIPENVKQKLILLMEALKLTTGSIDLIYTKQGEYVFLEVNPFGMMGHFLECNIDLDKLLAEEINNIVSGE